MIFAGPIDPEVVVLLSDPNEVSQHSNNSRGSGGNSKTYWAVVATGHIIGVGNTAKLRQIEEMNFEICRRT